jgi:hypothetical protein
MLSEFVTDLKIRFFLVSLFISLPVFAGTDQLSKTSLVSGTNQIVATIAQQGRGLHEGQVLNFRSSTGRQLETMKSDGFEKPVLFHYQGEYFVHVATVPEGSGGFVTDTIFWIAPDATMHGIDFEDAAEAYEQKVDAEEVVLSGGSGVNYSRGELKFEFYIANKADPHCCPTAGKVTGNYQIVGEKKFDPVTRQYSSSFKMVPTQYLRTPIASGEMSFVRLKSDDAPSLKGSK